jgi:hypothetical protein
MGYCKNEARNHMNGLRRLIGRKTLFVCAVAFWCAFAACPSANCQAAASGCSEELEAVSLIHTQFRFETPLRAIAKPNLEDRVIALKSPSGSRGSEVPLICFYLVEPAPYQLKGHVVESESVQLDVEREWIVALDQEHDLKLILEGSSDPNEAFNVLSRHLQLHVMSKESALDLFDFYLLAVGGETFRSRLVGDDLKLESIALEDFRLRIDRPRRRQAFDSWWRGVQPAIKKQVAPPTVIQAKNGYEVEYFLYDKGTISKQSLLIDASGVVAPGESKVIVGGS